MRLSPATPQPPSFLPRTDRLRLLLLAAVLPLSTCLVSDASAAAPSSVPAERVQRLAKGINIPGWLIYGNDRVRPFSDRVSDSDLDLIVRLGFNHVRIPIDWARIYDSNAPDHLRADTIAELHKAIETLSAKGLGVIIDLHHIRVEGEVSNYSGPLQSDPAFVDKFIAFWSSFAKRLSHHDPEFLFIEPMNEPTFTGMTEAWIPIQNRLIAEIRRNAPLHTILATSAQWSNLSTFLQLKPLDDPNIVYNFHYYLPFAFTHQAATWTSDWVRGLKNVPYPSSPEAVEPLLADLEGDAKRNLAAYGKERWDAARIEADIAKAGQWAKEYGVPVTCNEFGAHKKVAPPKDIVRWHHDLCSALSKHGIGWSKWELDSSFGFFTRRDGRLAADPALSEAMGLKAEAARPSEAN